MSPNPRGGRRSGAGRKRLAPDGLVSHNVTLSAEDWAVIEDLGRFVADDGKDKVNRSAGVRSLIEMTRDMFLIPSSPHTPAD